jgi:hypothetical protein
MSAFGSGEAGVAILVACGLMVPVFGWWPLGVACIVAVGWGVILSGANQKYHHDGTRKPQAKHGRDRGRT